MKTIEIEFEGLTLTADLWENEAPKLVEALWDSLPQEGQVTNTYWSGQMLRLWIQIPEPPGDPENASTLQHPGDILFVPGWNGLRFVYGQAQMRGPAGPHSVPKIGRLRGDLAAFAEKANRIQYDGAKMMNVRRKE